MIYSVRDPICHHFSLNRVSKIFEKRVMFLVFQSSQTVVIKYIDLRLKQQTCFLTVFESVGSKNKVLDDSLSGLDSPLLAVCLMASPRRVLVERKQEASSVATLLKQTLIPQVPPSLPNPLPMAPPSNTLILELELQPMIFLRGRGAAGWGHKHLVHNTE